MSQRKYVSPPKNEAVAIYIISKFSDCWKSFERGDSYSTIAAGMCKLDEYLRRKGENVVRRALTGAYFGFKTRKGEFLQGIIENANKNPDEVLLTRKKNQRLEDRLHAITGANRWPVDDELELIRLYEKGLGPKQIYLIIEGSNKEQGAISSKLDDLRREGRIGRHRINWEEAGPVCERLFSKKREKEVNAVYVARVLNRYFFGRDAKIFTRSKVNNYLKRTKRAQK